MTKITLKIVVMLSLLAVLIVSVAGCTSSLSSNQAAPSAAGAVSPSASASASATPSAAPSNTPSPTVTPPADVYQVVISGPTVLQPGEGGIWTATVYKNGITLPQADLTGKIYWFIDGQYHQTNTMGGTPINSGTMVSDANGESTTWAPFGAHTLNAGYIGVPSDPNTSITVTSLGVPSASPTAIPTPTPTPTPTFVPTPTLTPTPTVTPRVIRIV
jgi:hypothetical protein